MDNCKTKLTREVLMLKRVMLSLGLAVVSMAASNGTGLGSAASAEGTPFTECFYCDGNCCKLHNDAGTFACASDVHYPDCGSWCSVEGQDPCPESFDLVYGVDGVAARTGAYEDDVDRHQTLTANPPPSSMSQLEFRTCSGILLGRYYGESMGAHFDRMLREIML